MKMNSRCLGGGFFILWMAMAGVAIGADEAKVAPTSPTLAQAGKMVEVKLELPRPMFVGTPRDIVSSNLEPTTTTRRAPLMAPEGTKNLALRRPVTASDMEPIVGQVEQVTDGDRSAADGSYVEFGPGLQWVQIDLGEPAGIHGILLWHFHAQARVYRDVVVRISDDPDFLTGVTTVFNNDHDNSAGLGIGRDREWIETFEGKLIRLKGVQGRYVRLYSNGNTANDQNHMIEVEVYGLPAK